VLASLSAACGGGGGSSDSGPTGNTTPVLTTISVTLSPSSVAVGQTATASAAGLDQNGNAIAVGSVVWSTGSSSIASITATGAITGVAPGQALILAAAGGRSGQQTITVTPVPVATVAVTPGAPSLAVGATQQFTATTSDALGNVLTGRVVTWTSSDPTKVSVSSAGLATAVAAGSATITATSEGKTGSATATVTAATAAVATVTVAPSAPSINVGATQQLAATTKDAAGNVLTGRTVTWSSSDISKATVTQTGLVTAVATGSATITATSETKTGTATITVTPVATSVNLVTAGQSAAFLTSSNFAASLTLQAGSSYLITVINTDASSSTLEDFTLLSTLSSSSASRGISAPAIPRRDLSQGPRRFALRPDVKKALAAGRNVADAHLKVLENNRQVFAQFGNPKNAWTRARTLAGRSAPLSAAVTPTVGTVNKVYVKNSAVGSCTKVDSIGARTVAVGQHVIVVADTNITTWPQSFRPDSSYYQTFANEFDQVTYPHLIANIGDPLAYDASLSKIGKITVVLTPVLNNFAGLSGGGTVLAFVNGCDFFPFAASGPQAAFSNQTEMFYSLVPSANGLDVETWELQLRATAAHESKHIVSFTDRILNNSALSEEIWLEEGLAQVSSEIWERNFNQATWKAPANFLQTVACEIDLGTPCDPNDTKPFALIFSHLPFFFQYLQAESGTHAEGLAVDTPSNYGAGWAFARWVTDQYGTGSEGAFLKSVINTTQAGLTNLSTQTGANIPTLLSYWNAASGIFQTPAFVPADVRLTYPSFNFADIFNVGQTELTCGGIPCGLYTSDGSPSPAYPVQPVALSSGAFTQTVTHVPGTSAAYFLLTPAAAGVATMQLVTPSGTPLSVNSGFRVIILRVQ
jgi:hypothetical protein